MHRGPSDGVGTGSLSHCWAQCTAGSQRAVGHALLPRPVAVSGCPVALCRVNATAPGMCESGAPSGPGGKESDRCPPCSFRKMCTPGAPGTAPERMREGQYIAATMAAIDATSAPAHPVARRLHMNPRDAQTPQLVSCGLKHASEQNDSPSSMRPEHGCTGVYPDVHSGARSLRVWS